MKIRQGFVSNSSSVSFVIDVLRYPDVFSVAEEFLKRLYMMSLEDRLHGYEPVLFLDPIETLAVLEDAVQKGANRNRSVEFAGSCGTDIGRYKSHYLIHSEKQYFSLELWPACQYYRKAGRIVEAPEEFLEKYNAEPALNLAEEYLEGLPAPQLKEVVHAYYRKLLEAGDCTKNRAKVTFHEENMIELEFDEGQTIQIPANYVIEPYEQDSSDVQDLTFAYFPHCRPRKK